MSDRSKEVKVGILVLLSAALLAGFVLVLGDFSFSDRFSFFVEFENAGGLKPGADVAIAGLNVGTVEDLRFVAKSRDEADLNAVTVRAELSIDPEYAAAVRQKSEYFITTRGVLGEPYIEIVTTDFGSPPLEPGVVVIGVGPPRIDVVVTQALELVSSINELLRDPEIPIGAMVLNFSNLSGELYSIVRENRDEIGQIATEGGRGVREGADLLEALNVAVGDGRSLRQTMADAQATIASARRIARSAEGEIDPLLVDARAALGSTRAVAESAERALAGPEAPIEAMLADARAATADLRAVSSGARSIVATIERGEGTVGNLVQERELYDDLRALLRQLKRQPWKLLWKE